MSLNALETLMVASYFNACSPAIKWLMSLDADSIPWKIDTRGDWMLWFAIRMGIDPRLVEKVMNNYVKLLLKYISEKELESLNVVKYIKKTKYKKMSEKILVVNNCFKNLEYSHQLSVCATDIYHHIWNIANASYIYAHEINSSLNEMAYKADMLNKCANIVRKIIPELPFYMEETTWNGK